MPTHLPCQCLEYALPYSSLGEVDCVRDYPNNSSCGIGSRAHTRLAIQFRLGVLSERTVGHPAGRCHCVTACGGIAVLNLTTGSKA